MRYGGAIGLGILATGLLGMLSPQAAFALAQEISRSLDGRKIERDQLNQSHKNNQKILPQKITSQIEIKRTPGIKTQQRQLELLQLDLKKSRQRGDHKSEAETLNKISLVYTDLKKFKESLESSLQALNLYKQLKSQEGELNTIGNIIDVYFKLRKPQQSEQFIQEKIKEIRSSNDELSEKVFIGILRDRLKKDWRFSAGFGMVADGSLQRDYRDGKISWQEVLALSRFNLFVSKLVGNHAQEVESLHGIGWAYRNLGQFPDALDYYNQAATIAKFRAEKFQFVFLLVEIGIVYSDLGQYAKALEQFQLALSESSRPGDNYVVPPFGDSIAEDKYLSKLLRGFPLTKIGMIYVSLNQYDEALRYLQEAEETGVSWDKNTLYLGLGIVYFQKQDYDKALHHYQNALNIVVTGDASARGEILNRIGLLHLQRKDYLNALDSFQKALVIFKELKNPAGEAVTLSNIAFLVEKQNQPELAIAFYKQSVNTSESIRQNLRRLTIEEQRIYAATISSTYRSLADLLLSQGRVLEAQQVLELLKTQELRDFTRDTRAGGDTNGIPLTSSEAPISPAFSDKIALGQQLTDCENQTPRCAQRDTLLAQRQAANDTFNQLADRLRTLAQNQHAKDPAQLQRDELTLAAQKVVLAQPKTVLIYPLVLQDKLWLVWGTQAGKKGVIFDSKEIPVSRKNLATTVVKFRQLLTQPGDVQEFQQVSQQLYQWLIAPIRPQLEANGIQNLVFSLDRSTRYIPMAALHDGQHYLVEKFAISTILTAGTTDTSDKLAANPADNRVLGLGLSNAVSGFDALPNVETELNGIVRTNQKDAKGIYPGDEFLNQLFTRSVFKNLIDYRILHIATHGKFVAGKPEDSFLVLGNGDPLRIPEIKSMTDLNAIHLVVLSACETAKGGEDQEGIEVSGISYYFITNGAKAVMASLWLVNDASTSLLMQQFYKNLAQGQSKAAAMQQVQQAFIQGRFTANDAPARSDMGLARK